MRKSLRMISTIIAITSLCQPSLAWNGFGHMVVVSVAYRNLDSQTQGQIAKLLALNPYYKSQWAKLIPPGTASDVRKRAVSRNL